MCMLLMNTDVIFLQLSGSRDLSCALMWLLSAWGHLQVHLLTVQSISTSTVDKNIDTTSRDDTVSPEFEIDDKTFQTDRWSYS